MDNAGGSQIDRMQEFYQTSYVQLSASYLSSRLATARVAESRSRMAEYIHASDSTEVIMGSSTRSESGLVISTLKD